MGGMKWIVGVLAVVVAGSAQARTITPVTVTSASAQALAASVGPRTYLAIDNESTTADIACSFGGAAALNTAGSYTIPAGATRVWGPVGVGRPLSGAAINCISGATSSPATIESDP